MISFTLKLVPVNYAIMSCELVGVGSYRQLLANAVHREGPSFGKLLPSSRSRATQNTYILGYIGIMEKRETTIICRVL